MKPRSLVALCFLLCLVCPKTSVAQTASRVTAAVSDAALVTLKGNTHPLIHSAIDQGALPENTSLARMVLVLQRSTAQEAALKQLIDQQQDRSSSSYHQWLTPQALGTSFGPSEGDLAAVTSWLAGHGFTAIRVNAGRTQVEFTGTAGSVQNAFHTAMHRYQLNGQQFFANAADPAIPAALAPVVAGVASLNNFASALHASVAVNLSRDSKTGAVTRQDEATVAAPTTSASGSARPEYTTTNAAGQTIYAVTPYDLASIYNVQPLWTGSVDGTGETIAVVGDSDINAADFVNFRKLFDLPIGSTSGATKTQYLNLIYNGPDPGVTSDEIKGDADTQWSGAVAKGATIDYVVSQTTEVTAGSDLSASYIVDNNLAPVLVDSFSTCESAAGASYKSFISGMWEQAAAQGITVVVSAGDNGSAGCDVVSSTAASKGLAVNALASTPYNVAVGGTDFYMPNGGSAYWNASNDATTQASVKGYVPESTWNDSCTNANYAAVSPYSGETPEQVCNNAAAATAGLLTVRGGSGGASTYAKPSWQNATGVPADSLRDVPDVSLFAGDGSFGSLYFVCQQSATTSGSACALGSASTNFIGTGGTSFSAAAFAGMIALVDQKVSPKLGQGNVGYTLYALARQQETAGTSCNATGSPASSCIFNDITRGVNEMPCVKGSTNCNTSSAADPYGVLSGFASTTGYDRATGLGSVNAANLVNQWETVKYGSTVTVLTLAPTTITHGDPVTAKVTVTSPSGTPTGDVSIVAQATTGAVGSGTLANGAFTGVYRSFPGGSYDVNAYYAGDGTYAASESVAVNLTVLQEPSTVTEQILNENTSADPDVSNTTIQYGDILAVKVLVAGLSKQGVATGNVSIQYNGTNLYGGTYRLNSSGYTEVQTTSLVPNQYSFISAYNGDPSFAASTSAPDLLTVIKADTTATIAASNYKPTDNTTVTFTVLVNTKGYGFAAPSGIVTLTSNGKTLGSATLTGSTPGGSYDYGKAYITVPAINIPSDFPVTVTYPGDTNYNPSSATSGVVTVTPTDDLTTQTALTLSSYTVPPKSTIIFTANITSTDNTMTGAVNFSVDGQAVGTGEITAGVATASVDLTKFAVGSHTAGALFPGDATHRASFSGPVAFTITNTVGIVPSTTSITVTPTTAVQGTAIIVAATVTPQTNAAGDPVPTGTVQLQVDGVLFGSPVALDSTGNGSFTLVTSVIQPGTHKVSVYYAGDLTYMASYALATNFIITAPGNAPTQIALSNVPTQVGSGVTFPFTVTISPTSPTPTGTLEVIVDDGSPEPQQTLQGNPASITLDTSGLALGPHTLSVYYSGDTVYSDARATDVAFTIIPANSSFTLTPATANAHIPLEGSASNAVAFTVTPTIGGVFNVAFACTDGLPENIGCSFAPATVSINGVTAATTTLTFTVLGYAQNHGLQRGNWLALGGGVSLAGFLLCLLPRRYRRVPTLFAFLVVLALGAVSGCGGGIRPQQGPFNVTVTATSQDSLLGPTTRTAIVALTIGGKP